MSDLRDHSKACQHWSGHLDDEWFKDGHYLRGHVVIGSPGGFWCPGGRPVIIDYEAAAKAWVGLAGRQGLTYEDEVQILVDAALGIGDTE